MGRIGEKDTMSEECGVAPVCGGGGDKVLLGGRECVGCMVHWFHQRNQDSGQRLSNLHGWGPNSNLKFLFVCQAP